MRTLPFTVGVGALVLGGVFYLSRHQDRSFERIEAQGQPTADSLSAYAKAHGRCPKTLAQLGLLAPPSEHGPFTYRVYAGGAECELSSGDYFKDGEVVWWKWPPGDWYLNR